MKILKIHTLEKDWCDKDYAMIHAVFQLLADFVEEEKPDQIVDWNSDPEHKRAWSKIRPSTSLDRRRNKQAAEQWHLNSP
jgi:hypothetical protein